MSISQTAVDARESARQRTGEFGHQVHAESDIELSELDSDAMARRGRQIAALLEAGFVPSMAHTTRRQATKVDEAERNDWWRDHVVSGEQASIDRGQIAKMPDNYTPKQTLGRSLSGNRRTHRMSYSGAGVSVRMPSVSSIRRYAADEAGFHGGTFDLPVEITATGSGNTHSGWVRVTERNGRYHVTADSFPESSRVHTAEAVNSLLEARRVRTALSNIKSLPARHRGRLKARGIEIGDVSSSWIGGVGYDDDSQTLAVTMDGGTGARTYGYKATREEAETMAHASSPGRAYNELIKNRKKKVDVARCGTCGRFTSDGTTHECPIDHAAPTAGTLHGSNVLYEEAARAVTVPLADRMSRAERIDALSRVPTPRGSDGAQSPTDLPPSMAVTGIGVDTTDHGPDMDRGYDHDTPATPWPSVPPPADELDRDRPRGATTRRPMKGVPHRGSQPTLTPKDPDDGTTPKGRKMRDRLRADAAKGGPGPNREHAFGPRGFTVDVAEEIAAMGTTSRDHGDYIGIDGGDRETAAALLDKLPEENLEAQPNGGPSVRNLLTVQRDHDDVSVGGYVIPPLRADERVSLESVQLNVKRPKTLGYETYEDIDDGDLMWERAQRQYDLRAEAAPAKVEVVRVDDGSARVDFYWD